MTTEELSPRVWPPHTVLSLPPHPYTWQCRSVGHSWLHTRSAVYICCIEVVEGTLLLGNTPDPGDGVRSEKGFGAYNAHACRYRTENGDSGVCTSSVDNSLMLNS
jgi:hypothetical protein